jgi:hypothetical protein
MKTLTSIPFEEGGSKIVQINFAHTAPWRAEIGLSKETMQTLGIDFGQYTLQEWCGRRTCIISFCAKGAHRKANIIRHDKNREDTFPGKIGLRQPDVRALWTGKKISAMRIDADIRRTNNHGASIQFEWPKIITPKTKVIIPTAPVDPFEKAVLVIDGVVYRLVKEQGKR